MFPVKKIIHVHCDSSNKQTDRQTNYRYYEGEIFYVVLGIIFLSVTKGETLYDGYIRESCYAKLP